MAKLHELLAVMNDAASAASAIMVETSNTFSKKQDHFLGQTRNIKYLDEARSGEDTTESKELVTTVGEKLDHTRTVVSRYWNALLQLEATNQNARADLEIDGYVIAQEVPATFLLGMETRLKELRNVLLQMPTLQPQVRWERSPDDGEGVYRSDVQVSMRGEKRLAHKVLYDATDKHPAQIEKWTEDVPVARIEVTHRSGMLSPAEKSEMLERCDKLIKAVKEARQRANTVEVSDMRIAHEMFDYILKG